MRLKLGGYFRGGREQARRTRFSTPCDGAKAAAMTARILIVEDDPTLLAILQAAVSFGGFTSESVGSGAEAMAAFGAGKFDAVLMDLGLPDMDGSELLKALRMASSLPVIVVSGRGTEHDKIAALDLGADDYVSKPFLPGELLARIRAALRRHRGQAGASPSKQAGEYRDPINVGSLTLDPLHRSVEIGGRRAQLSDAEFKVLLTLATHEDGVVDKSSLLKTLYDAEVLEDTRIVEVYISNIRRKLRDLHDMDLILNFRGRGWKLVVPEH
jgi:DNA-binding response OmpR family regulator